MNHKMKIQRGKFPCKISPAAEFSSGPGPQDAAAGCPALRTGTSGHLCYTLAAVILPLVVASQAGALPNPSCPLNYMDTGLLFIFQRALAMAQCAAVFIRMTVPESIWLGNTRMAEKNVKMRTLEFEFMGTH